MTSRVVAPGTKRLDLSQGDWLLVKQQLNAGETMDLFERAAPGFDITAGVDLKRLAPTKVGMAIVLAYLLDWSLVDDDGGPIPIRDATPDEKEAALRLLDLESLVEIMDAISTHDAANREKKRARAIANASEPSSPSLVAAIGGTNG